MFPRENVYKELDYPDPDKPKGATAELDAAVIWGPYLVLIEAKAKQFRLLSQLGDPKRLRKDLEVNLEDAFFQAQRAARYLVSMDQVTFTERKTKRLLRVNHQNLAGIFLITISQHDLSGLALRFAELKSLKLFLTKEYPISMSIADLDTISELVEGPDVFLHYLSRRHALQHLPGMLHTDELELFGWYLDTRY